MDTMEDILADCNEVFRYDETRPQDRAYTVGRMESSEAVARETARIIAEGIAKELETDVR